MFVIVFSDTSKVFDGLVTQSECVSFVASDIWHRYESSECKIESVSVM